MNTRAANLWERLRASFWFVPTLMAGGAIVLSFATLLIDEAIAYAEIADVWWIYTGGAEGARALLSTVAGSVITVAGVTFSITVAVLTLASSQFGPRLLRSFMRDPGNQLVLGTFIATFLYCLLVLRTIRQRLPEFNRDLLVPHVSVSVAVVLAIASLGVLIYFIHHISAMIQAEHIVATVGRELDATVDRLYPERIGRGPDDGADKRGAGDLPPGFAQEARVIASEVTGYLQAVDADGLLRATRDHDVVLRLLVRPGRFVVRGSPLALVWPAPQADDAVCAAINRACILGAQRTQQQDIGFDINQLVEIAVRALSTGINDPFTAIRCVDQLSAALCRLAERELPAPARYDETGRLRVLAEPVSFADVVDAAFSQIRQYGRSSAAVTIRLLEAIAVVVAHTHRPEDRGALLRQANLIARGSHAGLPEASDREDVAGRYRAVVRAIERQKRLQENRAEKVLIERSDP